MAREREQQGDGAGRHPAEYLRKLAFFHDFDDHELRQFLAVGKWFRVPAGGAIIKEGTTERAFYILVRGEAEVSKSGTGKGPVVLTTLKTGACFGEMAVLAETCRTANVVASVESFILRVEPEILSNSNVFLQLKFYRRFCETLVARLDLANRRMAGQIIDEEEALRQVLVEGVYPREDVASDWSKPGTAPSLSRTPGPELPPVPDLRARQNPSRVLSMVTPSSLKAINPGVAKELRELISGDGAEGESRRFAELISLDPVLCCRVLQAANSSQHRRSSAVFAIPHAMVVVGVREMEEVVGKILDEAQGEQVFGGVEMVAHRFWQHGVVVGRIAELLKNVLCLKLEADIFIAGVLHDLGVLALDPISPDFYPQFARPRLPYPDQLQGERQYIGLDHAKASAGLKKGFWLPQVYWDVMHGHHNLGQVVASPLPTALIGLADLFAAERGAGLESGTLDPATVLESHGWEIIRRNHRPFSETNLLSFVNSFRLEMERSRREIERPIPL